MRGRKKKPLSEHRANGNPSKLNLDRLEAETPTPAPGEVEPPEGMGERPLALWRYYAPLLKTGGRLAPENRDCLAQMCVHLANANHLQRAMDELDYSKALREARQESTLVRAYMSELGLTPSSIRRVDGSAKPEARDELGDFREKRRRG